MLEGLTNTPSAFQWFMNNIFANMIDINVIVYLDDILVYSNDLSKHKRHVREVLRRLCTNGLFACADKCEFHITSCKYLRYMLSPDGLTMPSNKVQIIQDWPEPHKVKDIQSFLSFSNFYCRFIYGYSRITILLMRLTRKGIPWHFTDECHSAFNALKKAFTLVMEKFGSVRFSTLNLRTPNQTIHSVRQFSRTLNGTWRSGSKSVQFTFERSSNANVSWDPPAGRRERVHQCGAAAGGGGTCW